MIQDIAPHRLRNEYLPGAAAGDNDPVLHFRGKEILVGEAGNEIVFARKKDFPKDSETVFLFRLDEEAVFLLREDEPEIPEGFHYVPIQSIRRAEAYPKSRIFAAYTAYQLARWYRDNRFCGTCGTRTVLGDRERSIVCPGCGRTIYPRIIPAVIVAVTNGDTLLVTKYANRPFRNWALIAGFTEIGETLEQTVEREVREEVGLRVKNIRYYKSQPWGVVDDILAGFYCEVDGDPTIHLGGGELAEARWVHREDNIHQPEAFSLTNEMMTEWNAGRQPR